MAIGLPFKLPTDNIEKLVYTLQALLENLNFGTNIPGFIWEGTIPAASEVVIRNGLRGNVVPSGYLVTSLSGSPTLLRGAAEWTAEQVSLRNSSATTSLTARVFFIK